MIYEFQKRPTLPTQGGFFISASILCGERSMWNAGGVPGIFARRHYSKPYSGRKTNLLNRYNCIEIEDGLVFCKFKHFEGLLSREKLA